MTIMESECSCGEKISIEICNHKKCRSDGKRPFYPGASEGSTQLRCRKCHGWLMDTCEGAAFGVELKTDEDIIKSLTIEVNELKLNLAEQ